MGKKFNETSYEVKAENQNEIIMEYAPLIKYLATKVAMKSNFSVEVEELVNCGVLGLIDAIEKFDDSKDNKFKTYAEFRIRGSMLDYLREQDWIPRSVRDKVKVIDKTQKELEERLGRTPSAIEMADALNMSEFEYHQYMKNAKAQNLISLDESIANESEATRVSFLQDRNENSNPLVKLSSDSAKQKIATAIQNLPEREKMIVSLYYYEEMNLKEIGQVLEISESRVSQLHSKAMMNLKLSLVEVRDEISLAA